jgi:hypothetical protein
MHRMIEVVEAMESTAPVRKNRGRIGNPQTSDLADIRFWSDGLLSFLGEIDGDLSVSEVIYALGEWTPQCRV